MSSRHLSYKLTFAQRSLCLDVCIYKISVDSSNIIYSVVQFKCILKYDKISVQLTNTNNFPRDVFTIYFTLQLFMKENTIRSICKIRSSIWLKSDQVNLQPHIERVRRELTLIAFVRPAIPLPGFYPQHPDLAGQYPWHYATLRYRVASLGLLIETAWLGQKLNLASIKQHNKPSFLYVYTAGVQYPQITMIATILRSLEPLIIKDQQKSQYHYSMYLQDKR